MADKTWMDILFMVTSSKIINLNIFAIIYISFPTKIIFTLGYASHILLAQSSPHARRFR